MAVLADDTTEMKDSDLIRQCKLGHQSSFRLLYQRYQQKVRSTLFKLCGTELLDDLTQEVFIKAWKGLPKLRENAYFSTWLYRICWNVACDRRRQLARIKRDRQTLLTHDPDVISDPEDLLQIHYQEMVQEGLQHLKLDHRVVLILHDLVDLPQKEIASILDVPVGTVKSRLFNARKAMRNFLELQGVTI
ncbi:MAG: sigma-70 family RNA polymerase sigma factor [Cyanobacterium sp. T60_A2020_053]|nr:sigma-70 family RNA polymerase sigma factor [Cyanobacterium sp. T60_A2020_053]